jgi:hypothetical protein
MIDLQFRRIIFLNVIVAFIISVLFNSCTSPSNAGKVSPNAHPQTSIANVPPPDSTHLFSTSKVSLYWSGKDDDGFITAYRFRWLTYQGSATTTKPWRTIINLSYSGELHSAFVVEVKETNPSPAAIPGIFRYLSTLTGTAKDSVNKLLDSGRVMIQFGDTISIANTTEITNPSTGTFIFDSGADSNIHRFEVKAIDNKGAEDLTPAFVTFGTPHIYSPETVISYADLSVINGRKTARNVIVMLPSFTPTYTGNVIPFFGSDTLSPQLEFQWQIDGGAWSPFSIAERAIIRASNCDSSNNGWFDTSVVHRFVVRARNQFQLVDLTPDTLWFRMYVPEFIKGVKRYLFLDNTDSLNIISGGLAISGPENPAPLDRFAFYDSALSSLNLPGQHFYYLVTPKNFFPSLFTLAKYSAVFFVTEKKVRGIGAQVARRLPIKHEGMVSLGSYLNLGGKMVISSWDLFNRIYETNDKAEFYQSFLHLNEESIRDADVVKDCSGAFGSFGYPNVTWDESKLLAAPNNAMDSIITGYPLGLGEKIYSYNSRTHRTNWHMQPMGVRYIGPTFKIVYFGFPLYYTSQTAAREVLRKAFQDIGELP